MVPSKSKQNFLHDLAMVSKKPYIIFGMIFKILHEIGTEQHVSMVFPPMEHFLVLDMLPKKPLKKKLMPYPIAILPLEFCIASQNTSFWSTFKFLHGLGYGI